jgi:hypothetical protein
VGRWGPIKGRWSVAQRGRGREAQARRTVPRSSNRSIGVTIRGRIYDNHVTKSLLAGRGTGPGSSPWWSFFSLASFAFCALEAFFWLGVSCGMYPTGYPGAAVSNAGSQSHSKASRWVWTMALDFLCASSRVGFGMSPASYTCFHVRYSCRKDSLVRPIESSAVTWWKATSWIYSNGPSRKLLVKR